MGLQPNEGRPHNFDLPGKRSLPIPDYDVLSPFILHRLLRTAGMTVDEFTALL